MLKTRKKLLGTTKRVIKENAELQQLMREQRVSMDAINAGNIDAVVIGDKKTLKVLTDKTADKTYRILIEKMNEGAVTLDRDGTILYCNSYFAKLVRMPLRKVTGAKFKKFIAPTSIKRFVSLFGHHWHHPVNEEGSLQTNDGIAIPVLVSVNTLTVDNNSVLSLIITDLTIHNENQEKLRRRTEQLQQKNIELENANNDLTAFNYLSSHDLQEPLRKIQTFVSVLSQEEYKDLSENARDYFSRIQDTAKRMQVLIEDLLMYSRTKITDGKFIKTDLSLIAEQVKKEFEEDIRKKKATINIGRLCETKIIPFQFHQLLYNLISNSLKFFNPEKRIRITIKSKIAKGNTFNYKKLFPDTAYCHIIYTDNGIGFDPRYKDRIFEVFQRLHNKETYPGTGIGLAICKRIVENHHGFIDATGNSGKGARFDIYIPAN